MAGADARVVVDFIANTRGLQRGARDASGATKTLGANLKSMGKAAAAVGLTVAAAEMGRMVKAGSDLNESINAVGVTFGNAAPKVLEFSKHASDLGLSMNEANQLLVPIGAALQNYGLSADQAATASIDLATRAADMASVFNTDVPSAIAAIQAGLRGEADPLEKYGVGLSAAAVQAEALAETGKKSAKSLTQQELATARVGLIMKQTDRYAGDFKNTSDGLANGQRVLQARFENIEAQMGKALLPTISAVLAVFTKYPQIIPVLVAVIGGLVVALTALSIASTIAAAAELAVLWPVLLVIAAIAALIVVAVLLYKNWDRITTAMRKAVDDFKNGAVNAFDTIKTGIVDAINWIGDTIAELPGKILDANAAVNAAALSLALKIVVGIKNGIIAAKDWIGTVIGQIPGKIRAWLAAVDSAAKAIAAKIVAGIKNGVIAAKDWIGTVIGQIPSKISAGLAAVASAAAKIGAAIVQGIKDGVVDAKDWVGTVVGQIVGKITGAVPAIQTAANKIGSAIASGIKNGIAAAITWVGSQITGIGTKLGNLLKKIPGAGAIASLGRSAPAVPHLAAGGVLTRPTLFLGGEAGREIVTPERLLREILDEHGGGDTYQLNLTTQRADAADIAYGFRRLELLRTGR